MAFGNKNSALGVNVNRVAAVAGATAVAQSNAGSSPPHRVSVEPDLSRMRKCSIEETDEERKQRLAAKTMNFGATILLRIAILGGIGFYAWGEMQNTGKVENVIAIGALVVLADLGRVIMKAMQPGSK